MRRLGRTSTDSLTTFRFLMMLETLFPGFWMVTQITGPVSSRFTNTHGSTTRLQLLFIQASSHALLPQLWSLSIFLRTSINQGQILSDSKPQHPLVDKETNFQEMLQWLRKEVNSIDSRMRRMNQYPTHRFLSTLRSGLTTLLNTGSGTSSQMEQLEYSSMMPLRSLWIQKERSSSTMNERRKRTSKWVTRWQNTLKS